MQWNFLHENFGAVIGQCFLSFPIDVAAFFFFGQASLHAIFINASGELMKGLSNLRNGNRFQNNVYLRDASSYCFS